METLRGLLPVVLLVTILGLLTACGIHSHHDGTHRHHGSMADCGCCCNMAAAQTAPGAVQSGTSMGEGQGAESRRMDVLYSCNCGPGCKCSTLAKTPGLCSCGKPLAWGHVVRVEGDEALLCTCAQGCQCAFDPKDPTKCGCGQPVKQVSLKGSGLFFCNCGGSCACNTVSMAPDTCRCGMPLKQVN